MLKFQDQPSFVLLRLFLIFKFSLNVYMGEDGNIWSKILLQIIAKGEKGSIEVEKIDYMLNFISYR